MAADKDQLRMEYITTKVSLRALARKYDRDKDTVCRWAKEEDWEGQRRQHSDRIQTKVLEKDMEIQTDRLTVLTHAADLLLQKVVKGIESAAIVTPTAAKNYSDALKNIKEIQMIRTEEDIEEQKARIAKLRKDTEKADTGSHVTVIIEGDSGYGE